MTEQNILELYYSRDETAIHETEQKYGNYCFSIANNILADSEDAKESVNDTYFETWNRIPPTWPNSLKAFLGKICRHISISKYRHNKANKRVSGEVHLCIEELEECIPAGFDLQSEIETKELLDFIDDFLFSLPERVRNIFISRYWYVMTIPEISKVYGINENTVKTLLHRTRKALLQAMEKEGWK